MDLTYLSPPEEGRLNVVQLSASTATSAIDLLAGNASQSVLVTFICDVDFYITFSVDRASVTDPNMTATTGDGRTWGPISSKTPWSRHIGARNRYCKVISADDGYVRWRAED